MPASTIIQIRKGTAALWASTNPILAQGEMGYETDTNKLKIGDGVSTWSVLAYGGPQGPAQTQIIESYGDGSDGTVTISSGLTTLTRDMFYANLTLSGTGQINTAGYRIFVSGILNLSNAAVGAIYNNGGAGANATTQTGGAAGTGTTAATIGNGSTGGGGGTGVVGAGVQPAGATPGQNGGSTNSAGASGAGGPNAGGTAGAAGRAGSASAGALPIRRYEVDLLKGITLIIAGSGAPGGSAGSGDGVTLSNTCGGGGGGSGGGVVGIWANTISRGSSTPASCIQALGGNGGNGRSGMGTYTFTISAGSTASVGATYTNNGQTFVVTTPLTSIQTSLVMQTTTTGTPSNTGTLTLASGTGSSTITYTVVTTTSSAAAATAGIGGGGGGAGGGGGWIYIQYSSLTGTTATNMLDASGGAGGLGGNGANNYTFTVTAGQTASVGATFTNNSQTFYVTTALTIAQTTLICVGTGSPSASGTLTKQNGTSSGNITFSTFTAGTTAAGGGGGSGGNGGRVTLLQVPTSTGSESFTGTGSAGAANSGIFGGTLGAAGVNQVSL